MTNDLAMYLAVRECRRLVHNGMSLPSAAAEAAGKFNVLPLHVSEHAARAIKACREAREERR